MVRAWPEGEKTPPCSELYRNMRSSFLGPCISTQPMIPGSNHESFDLDRTCSAKTDGAIGFLGCEGEIARIGTPGEPDIVL